LPRCRLRRGPQLRQQIAQLPFLGKTTHDIEAAEVIWAFFRSV